MKMKKKYKRIIFVTFLVINHAVIALVFGCNRGCFTRDKIIPPSESTVEKFEAVSKWIPGSTNAILTMDIYALSHSNLWNDILNLGRRKLLKNFEAAGLNFKSDIGLATIFMEAKSLDKIKGPVILIQGGFKKDLILSRIMEHAAEEKLDIVGEEYKDIKIYSEKEKEGIFGTSFAFAALPGGIIAAGKVNDLKWIIDNKSSKPDFAKSIENELSLEKPIWGKIDVPDLFSNSIPEPWNSIAQVGFHGVITEDLDAVIVAKLKNGHKTAPIKTALEGLRALEAIQLADIDEMLNMIDKIKIDEEEQKIVISIPKELNLLNSILSKKLNKKEVKEEAKKENIKDESK